MLPLKNGEKYQIISQDVYLGNIVGECSSNEIRSKVTTDDFIRKANTVMSQFRLVPHSIKYKLFKSFCSSLYGFLLRDMSAKSINKFYISWRKCLRQLYQLPYKTHNNLLHLISATSRYSISPNVIQIYNIELFFIQSRVSFKWGFIIEGGQFCFVLLGCFKKISTTLMLENCETLLLSYRMFWEI